MKNQEKMRKYILFIFLMPVLLHSRAVRATVFEFGSNGEVTVYEASDYLSVERHLHVKKPIMAPKESGSYNQIIKAASDQYGVSPDLIHAVIRVESSYNSQAVSSKGASGLMQLMPETARLYGVKDRFSAEENIYGGARLLRHLLDRYEGDISLVAAAYNAGERAVDRYKGIPPYQETQEYVQKIWSNLEKME